MEFIFHLINNMDCIDNDKCFMVDLLYPSNNLMNIEIWRFFYIDHFQVVFYCIIIQEITIFYINLFIIL